MNKLLGEDPDLQNGAFTYYQTEGWDSYANFEDDATYAIQGMQSWASQYLGITVDLFYVDNFPGDITP